MDKQTTYRYLTNWQDYITGKILLKLKTPL